MKKLDKYDYLIVGSGLYGATFARLAREAGKACLVIDRRSHVGGNVHCERVENINVHGYGPHIFHTRDKKVWSFINRFTSFNRFTLCTIANYRGELYNLPFNMNTFHRMWNVNTPEEALPISCCIQAKSMTSTVAVTVGCNIARCASKRRYSTIPMTKESPL